MAMVAGVAAVHLLEEPRTPAIQFVAEIPSWALLVDHPTVVAAPLAAMHRQLRGDEVAGERDKYGDCDWSWFSETQVAYPPTPSGEYA